MMAGVNKVILIGNLGRDPEVNNTKSGDQIVNLSVATNETWRDRQTGERKERVEWHRVAIFNQKLGDIAKQYLKKGSKIYIEGQIRTRKYVGQDGQEKYTTEIVLQNYRGELVMMDEKQHKTTAVVEPYVSAAIQNSDDLDDEIPF